MGLQTNRVRLRLALRCRMVLAVAVLALAMLALVALEVVLIAVASAAFLIVPYGAATIALESAPPAIVVTAVVYAGLVVTLWCAVRAMRADEYSEAVMRIVLWAYAAVVISSLFAVGYTVVDILSYSGEAAALICGLLAVGGYVSALVFLGKSWSDEHSESQSVDFSTDPDAETDDGPVGVRTELRRAVSRVRRIAGPREYLLIAVATFVALGAVYAGAAAMPQWYHLPALVVAGSLCLVGAAVGATVRSELGGDAAVLRDLERTVRFEASATAEDESEPEELTALQRTVDRLAAQAAVPAPEVRVGSSAAQTAVTAGYRPATSTIVVSRGLVDALDEREREAVLAHELAHVSNRDAAVMTFLSVPGVNANAAMTRHFINPVVAIPAALTYAVSRWCIAIVSSTREYAADDGAVALTGDPAALASALETLDRDLTRRPSSDLREHRSTAAFSIVPPPWEEHRFFDRTRRFVARRLLGTHPPTEKRIERLEDSVDVTG